MTASHVNGTSIDVTNSTQFVATGSCSLSGSCYNISTAGTAAPQVPGTYKFRATWTDPTGVTHTDTDPTVKIINPVDTVTQAFQRVRLAVPQECISTKAPLSLRPSPSQIKTTITRQVGSTPSLSATQDGGYPLETAALNNGQIDPTYTAGASGQSTVAVTYDPYAYATSNVTTTVNVFDPIQRVTLAFPTGSPIGSSLPARERHPNVPTDSHRNPRWRRWDDNPLR